jgi:hypothetical protein
VFRRRLTAALAGVTVGLLSISIAAPAQAAEPTSDQLVQLWYADFLGRPDPAADPGRGYWVDRLEEGTPARYVLGSIIRSYEYAGAEVGAYYRAYLNRPVDPGARYWVESTVHDDMAFEWVAQNILASPEYVRASGPPTGDPRADRMAYVDNLFPDVLGRFPSQGETAYWSDRVGRVGPLAAVRELWYTDEAVRGRLADNYVYLLGRDVDLPGLDYWTPVERQSDITLQVELAVTDEYADDAAASFP